MEKEIKTIVDEFYDEMKSSEYFSVFFKNNPPAGIAPIIINFIRQNLSFRESDVDISGCVSLGEQHAAMSIPLINILGFIDFFSTKLVEYIDAGKIESSEINLENINIIKNYFSKGYLQRAIDNTDNISIPLFSIFSTTKIITSILAWQFKIQEAVLSETAPNKKILISSKCNLSNYFQKPFFRMIFSSSIDLSIFIEMHEELHNIANSLFYFIGKKDYMQSFYLYTDFADHCNKFLGYFFERIILFEQNKESYFYNCVSSKLKNGKSVNLYTFNIRNLGIVNKVWGSDYGDFVLDEMEAVIDRLHGMESSNSIFIKTLNADYLIANISEDGSMDNFHNTIDRLKKINFQRDEFKTEVKTACSFLKLQPGKIDDPDKLKLLVNKAIAESKRKNDTTWLCTNINIDSAIEDIERDENTKYFLRQAFTKNNFTPFYHSIHSSGDEKTHHAEVLARVCDDNTCMSAGLFIDYLVKTNRVVELDRVILRKVMKDMDTLKQATNNIFVNVSPKSLRSVDYLKELKEFIKFCKAKGMEITFEITEQSLLDNVEIVKNLHEQDGAIFAIDDFGAGYSNFSIVSDMAQEGLVKYLKLDGSLIENMCGNVIKEHIVKGIIDIAKNLNLKTVAEFVSNEETAKKVKELGVDYMQGFHYSQPCGLQEFIK